MDEMTRQRRESYDLLKEVFTPIDQILSDAEYERLRNNRMARVFKLLAEMEKTGALS